MRHSFGVHVLNGINEHFEEASAYFRFEPSFLGDVLEELASLCELQHDDWPGGFWLSGQIHFGIQLRFDNVDEMLKIELGKEINFTLEGFLLGSAWEVNFDCI